MSSRRPARKARRGPAVFIVKHLGLNRAARRAFPRHARPPATNEPRTVGVTHGQPPT